MDYTWPNSSWQMMEAMRKQEQYQSKLARDNHNFYHVEISLLKDINGVGIFSSYDKSYGHTSYDDYRGYERVNAKYVEHSPYVIKDFMIVMTLEIIVMVEEFTMRA
ncbi:hypothetical protein M9H77_02466 [Catharanthus roseus]|uniref:Uncharacterized protein n=1 Tax=Catharanthus roseus TaxID=4058 RepID=A0ACC0C8W6_CATRO|nr:hypothetical protein M9H77_02466 [Catharanthus roseus]